MIEYDSGRRETYCCVGEEEIDEFRRNRNWYSRVVTWLAVFIVGFKKQRYKRYPFICCTFSERKKKRKRSQFIITFMLLLPSDWHVQSLLCVCSNFIWCIFIMWNQSHCLSKWEYAMSKQCILFDDQKFAFDLNRWAPIVLLPQQIHTFDIYNRQPTPMPTVSNKTKQFFKLV